MLETVITMILAPVALASIVFSGAIIVGVFRALKK